MSVACWERMPYVTALQIRQIFEDLPEASVAGRNGEGSSGRVCGAHITLPIYASMVKVVTPDDDEVLPEPQHTGQKKSKASLRKRLEFVEDMDTKEREKWVNRYKCMPDHYNDGGASTGPMDLLDEMKMRALGHEVGSKSTIWELCAGSGKLSAWARQKAIRHLPPVDYRWGYDMRMLLHQIPILFTQMVYGCDVLFASPNCTPWGANARIWPQKVRHARRHAERKTLQFLAVMCFLQVVMGRSYIVEKPQGSEIFSDRDCSSIAVLEHCGVRMKTNKFDQCMHGAEIENQSIRKSTEYISDQDIPEVIVTCDGSHKHLQLTGRGPDGSRTAVAAVFDDETCKEHWQQPKESLQLKARGELPFR